MKNQSLSHLNLELWIVCKCNLKKNAIFTSFIESPVNRVRPSSQSGWNVTFMYSLTSPSTTSFLISWSLSQESLSMSALASDGLSIATFFEFQTPNNFLCCFILQDYRRSDETSSESFRNVEHDNLWGHHVTADLWWLRWPKVTTWKYMWFTKKWVFFSYLERNGSNPIAFLVVFV